MNASLEKIEALEANLAASLAGRPATLDAVTACVTKAEAVLACFQNSPLPGDVDKALAAVAIVEAGKLVIASFGEPSAWTASARARWLAANFGVLVGALEKQLELRSAPRGEFRKAMAEKVGSLSGQIVLADGENAPDSELTTLNDRLAAMEDDLANREGFLHSAHASLRDLKRAPSPTWSLWLNARFAVDRVSFYAQEEN
jgi:hypothetical protein